MALAINFIPIVNVSYSKCSQNKTDALVNKTDFFIVAILLNFSRSYKSVTTFNCNLKVVLFISETVQF